MNNSNKHRKDKKSFHAFLKPVEHQQVLDLKRRLGVKTDRELLIAICDKMEKKND